MMYYKMINDRMVFSTPEVPEKKLYITALHAWRSNPSAEDIAAEGWLPVPPAPPYVPQPELDPDYDQVIQAVKKMLASSTEELSDEAALNVAALFPTWLSKVEEAEASGKGVEAGERLWYDGKLYKVVQAHVPQRTWTPDHTPALFTEISIEEWPEIPENIPSTAPWMKGDKGTWKGQHYICTQNNCTWNPDQYPAAWELQP